MRPNFPVPSQQQPQQPPMAAPAASKPKEWTPAQYGGYVPPADGKGGGQVLIKSVNGKVVITPIPGTGNNPPLTAAPSPTTAAPATTTPAPAPPPAATKKAAPVKASAPALKKGPASAV